MSNGSDPMEERRLDELLREASAVPPAPDCRNAVMARISRRSPMWAYVLAISLVVAFGLVGALVVNRPQQRQVQRIAQKAPERKQAPVVKREPVAQQPVEPKPEVVAKEHQPQPVVEQEHRQVRRPAEQPKSRMHPSLEAVPKPQLQAKKRNTAPAQSVAEQPAPEPVIAPETAAPPQDRPLALVVVTWPSSLNTGDTSYSYKETDPETGDTTTCSVTRSGDSINVRLESTPGGGQPPMKGCVEHEPKKNA